MTVFAAAWLASGVASVALARLSLLSIALTVVALMGGRRG